MLHGAQATLSAAVAYMQISSLLLKGGVTAAGQSGCRLTAAGKENLLFRQDILKWQK